MAEAQFFDLKITFIKFYRSSYLQNTKNINRNI